MSICNNKVEYDRALEKALKDHPLSKYYKDKADCKHSFDFIIYCDGDFDIVRCSKCGMHKVVPCTFDDEYD